MILVSAPELCPECHVGVVIHVSDLPYRTRYVCSRCPWNA